MRPGPSATSSSSGSLADTGLRVGEPYSSAPPIAFKGTSPGSPTMHHSLSGQLNSLDALWVSICHSETLSRNQGGPDENLGKPLMRQKVGDGTLSG